MLVPAIFAIAIGLMWCVARYQQEQFEKLSARASALRVGESTFSDVEVLRRHYQSQSTIEDGACTPSSCKLRIVLYNFLVNPVPEESEDARWINMPIVRRLGLRPAAAMVVAIVGDGKVKEVHFFTEYERPNGRWLWAQWHAVGKFPRAFECDKQVLQRHPAYMLVSGRTGEGMGFFVSTTFLPQANPDERQRSQHIRFECMTSAFDCGRDPDSGARLLMPLVYHDILEDDATRNADPAKYSAAVQACLSENTHRSVSK